MWKKLKDGIVFSLSPISGVLFSDEILTQFKIHIQSLDTDKEAGGILIGEIRDDNYVVLAITEPQRKDGRSRCGFCRKDKNHIKLFTEFHQKNSNLTYIGEWHTHPEKKPSPSAIDVREWDKIKKAVKHNFIVLILGTESFYCKLW